MAKTPSPFRWVGSKARLLPIIEEYLPAVCHNYWEVFLGGGALFFHYGYKRTGTAFLSDINFPLVNAYDHLQCSLDSILCKLTNLQNTPYSAIRDEFNRLKRLFDDCDSTESSFEDGENLAACFIALNHLCFNGLYRENKKGEFNVPVGRDSKGNVRTLGTLSIDALVDACEKLNSRMPTNINAVPFHPYYCPILPKSRDVWFGDPPYIDEFSAYDKAGFTLDDHKTLFNQALAHAERGATVVLCGSNNEPTREIYGTPTRVIELSRTVGASKRGKAEEALWVWNGVKK